MSPALTWQDVDSELQRLYNEINREQAKLFARAMSLKGKLHDIQELQNSVKAEISKQEESDDAADNS